MTYSNLDMDNNIDEILAQFTLIISFSQELFEWQAYFMETKKLNSSHHLIGLIRPTLRDDLNRENKWGEDAH